MKYILLFLVLGLLFSCENKPKSNDFYVIKNITETNASKKQEISVFYGDHNFILVDSATIYYYHYIRSFGECGTGIDDTKPPKLGLFPDSLIKINKKDLETFLKKKISTVSRNTLLISISSPTDTIKNQALSILRTYFKPRKKVLVGIRKCTEEEEYVAFAKLYQKAYDPKKIKWKVGFSQEEPRLEIKFLPPVVE